MKKLSIFLVVLLVGVFLVSGIVLAADKLAYIDLSRAFSEYNKTKDYDKKLTDKEKAFIAERDKKVNEFNAFRDKFALLSDKEKEAKKGELESKANVLKDFLTQKEEELRKEQEEKMKEILNDIQDAVNLHAEKSGITLVFNDRGLVYRIKAMDITSNIIDILNNKKR